MSGFSVKKAVELAIRTERDGAEFYSDIAQSFSDNQDLAGIFNQLSSDEKAHEREFSSILKNMPDSDNVDADSNAFYLLQATSVSEFFKQDAIKNKTGLTPKDALLTALNFEKATLMHYHALAEVLGETPQLKGLIQAEKNHVAALMKVAISDAQFRGLADSW
ncbi:MAG: ferritin family protein [Fibrobacteria bacterium]|nr:ferritin family protein [Fibrobacteria bacterium]